MSSEQNLDLVLQQQIMDQFRKDNEALQEQLEKGKSRSIEETKAKLAARRARRQEEARRQAEGAAAQRILEEQSKAVAANKPMDAEHIAVPDVILPRETTEEQVRSVHCLIIITMMVMVMMMMMMMMMMIIVIITIVIIIMIINIKSQF